MLGPIKSGDKMRLPGKSGQVTVWNWVNATTLSLSISAAPGQDLALMLASAQLRLLF